MTQALRIGFDATTVAFGKKTGTGVYSIELIRAFEKTFPDDQIFHTYRLARAIKGREHFLPLAGASRRHILQDPWTLWRGRSYDIFHGLNARLPLLVGTKKVVTIHDLFSLFGQFSEKRFLADQKRKIRATLARASHIITPAHFTKNQLVEKLRIPLEKISVVGEGVREEYLRDFDVRTERSRVWKKLKVEKPFFLYVGTLEKRKNVTGILEAFARFDSKSPDTHNLVLVGGEGFGFPEIKKKISELRLTDKTLLLGHVEEAELATLYRSATALLFLSWEEGYGIPVIEAMACGLPVISSNTTSLPEVGAGFTSLVSPTDPSEATEQMLQISRGGEAMEKKRRDAMAFARTLTWSKVARDTRAVYERVLQEK